MNRQRIVLITRKTRLAEVVSRHNTFAQAKFYLEHLGADVGDYLREDEAYHAALAQVTATLQQWGRYQVVERALLANFVFAADDIVVTLGQDGLVANTLKYLRGQPLIGINPDEKRWDGLLLPFSCGELPAVLAQVDKRPRRAVTLAEARLSDGQTLLAINDLFIGPRSHTSALYDLLYGGKREAQSSSGVIVSTGLGSTAWIKSIITGAQGIVRALGDHCAAADSAMAWDAEALQFAVREPFPSRNSRTDTVFGRITAKNPLRLRSRMEGGVIFSDGMEADFLRFDAGMEVQIGIAAHKGVLLQ